MTEQHKWWGWKRAGGLWLILGWVSLFYGTATYSGCVSERNKQARSRAERACRDDDHPSSAPACAELVNLAEAPCERDHEPDACRRLAYLELFGYGGLHFNPAAAAAHFGVACGKGDKLACRVLTLCLERRNSEADPLELCKQASQVGQP